MPNFRLDRFILSPSVGENPIFCRFWTSAFSGVASWQQSEKVEQLQTFPYPTASKSFLYSFMAKSGA